ncbi:hypothetical protein NUSPORA_02222 [Nucleospora cyclopteri]
MKNSNSNDSGFINIEDSSEEKISGAQRTPSALIRELFSENSDSRDKCTSKRIETLQAKHKFDTDSLFSLLTGLLSLFTVGIIYSTFSWHNDLVTAPKKITIELFIILDASLLLGAVAVSILSIKIKFKINQILCAASGILMVSSLGLKVVKPSLIHVNCFRFALGVGVGLIECNIKQYLKVVFPLLKNGDYLIDGMKFAGSLIGFLFAIIMKRNCYEGIFALGLAQIFLYTSVCKVVKFKNTLDKKKMPVGSRIAAFSVFIFSLYILQAILGRNILLSFNNLITSDEYVDFYAVQSGIIASFEFIRYFYFNYKISLLLLYCLGVSASIIAHVFLYYNMFEKYSLFVLFLVYNIFIFNLPEMCLGTILTTDAHRLTSILSRVLIFCSDFIAKIIGLFVDKQEMKTALPLSIFLILVLNICYNIANKRRNSLND